MVCGMCLPVHHFKQNILKTMGWIAITFGSHIHRAQRSKVFTVIYLKVYGIVWQWNNEKSFMVPRGCILVTLMFLWLLLSCHFSIEGNMSSQPLPQVPWNFVHTFLSPSGWTVLTFHQNTITDCINHNMKRHLQLTSVTVWGNSLELRRRCYNLGYNEAMHC